MDTVDPVDVEASADDTVGLPLFGGGRRGTSDGDDR